MDAIVELIVFGIIGLVFFGGLWLYVNEQRRSK